MLKQSRDTIEMDRCLNELKSYENKVNLSEEQLAVFANKLTIKDLELRRRLLSFMRYQLLRSQTNIVNKQPFLQISKIIPSPCKRDIDNRIKEPAIHLLGLVGLEKELIAQLNADCRKEWDKVFRSMWDTLSKRKAVALIIEKHRSELFKSETEFSKKNDVDAFRRIRKVRQNALDTLDNGGPEDDIILKGL